MYILCCGNNVDPEQEIIDKFIKSKYFSEEL